VTQTTVRRAIIAPHCDDETLGCGGLLAKYPDECGVIVIAEPDEVRKKEFYRAQEILGYTETWFLNVPDGSLAQDMRTLVGLLDNVMSVWRPTDLYLPFPSLHQDHIAAYEAGMRTARLSMSEGHHYVPSVFVYDVAVYDTTLYPSDLKWNTFLALDEEQIDRKVEALVAYDSQAVTGPHPANSAKQMAHALGVSRQLPWAEQYAAVRQVWG
jgi:N-acetylglucosamine malate deacetylase 1